VTDQPGPTIPDEMAGVIEAMDPEDRTPLLALASLCERGGSTGMEFGYSDDGTWYAHADMGPARLRVERLPDPTLAAYALAMHMLRISVCRCGKRVSLIASDEKHCHWTLSHEKLWHPACNAPTIRVNAARGDLDAMEAAFAQRFGRDALDGLRGGAA
jgi:hypothetical protein